MEYKIFYIFGKKIMIETLKTVKEFKDLILEDVNTLMIDRGHSFRYLCNYIDLLEQPLNLGMFIPCDEDDKPYDKEVVMTTCTEIYNEYWIAEERVLFAGFEYEDGMLKNGELTINVTFFNWTKISDLTKTLQTEIKLTNNFKKLITG